MREDKYHNLEVGTSAMAVPLHWLPPPPSWPWAALSSFLDMSVDVSLDCEDSRFKFRKDRWIDEKIHEKLSSPAGWKGSIYDHEQHETWNGDSHPPCVGL